MSGIEVVLAHLSDDGVLEVTYENAEAVKRVYLRYGEKSALIPRAGKWERYLIRPAVFGYDVLWMCSECGGKFENQYKYCPNCGAKMEGCNETD